MFDIGFWEISLIGVIALLVVGPERLPGMARNVGFWVGRIRRYVNQVKADVEREINAEEFKQAIRKPEGLEDLYDAVDSTRETVEEARNVLRDAGSALEDELEAKSAPAVETPEPPPAPAAVEDATPDKPSTWTDAVARELSRDEPATAADPPGTEVHDEAPPPGPQTDDGRR